MNIRAIAKNAAREAEQERQRKLNYLLIYRLVRRLDPDPCHDKYCYIGGQRCDTLGEVVAAILEN